MRLLALLFLTACGSSSTFVATAPLESSESTTKEHEIASAPLDAGPERSCWCPEVTIRCSGAGSSAHARADRAACVLDLPARSCALLGLADESKVDPEAILRMPSPADATGNDVWEVCTAKHEARHACDGAAISVCQSELTAYDVSLDCMNAYAEDEIVAFNVENVLAAREMNECLCAGSACAACSKRCHEDHPTRSSTCEQAASVYCP